VHLQRHLPFHRERYDLHDLVIISGGERGL
jgi:hypothetical protein